MFINHVNLQGYLEITSVDSVKLGKDAVPVMHGILHAGDFLSQHKLLLTDYPASFTIEMVRQFQSIKHGQMIVELDGEDVVVTINKGFPLVTLEGRLLSQPGQESVVEVRWIYFLSIPTNQIDFKDVRLDEIVANLVDRWWEMTETERQLVYEYLHGYFAKQPLRS